MKNIGLILVAVALLTVYRPELFSFLKTSAVVETPSVPAPSASLREVVRPIVETNFDRNDAERIARFYLALADVIERDETGIVQTGGEIRTLNERSGRLCFGRTGIAGRYPDLPDAVDAVIGYGIGSKRVDGKWEAVEITPESRRELAVALRAVAWACRQ